MIVIKVELWPFGDESRAKTLGQGHIYNDASGSSTRGNYKVRLFDAAGRQWKQGEVKNFPRKRLLGWDLLYRALENLISDRK